MKILKYLFYIMLICLVSCKGGPSPAKGPEVTLQEIKRIEKPFDIGIEILASKMNVILSRNYIQDETLCTPAGGGAFHKVMKRKNGFRWVVAKGPAFLPLKFRFRKLKATILDELVVDFPPVKRFTAEVMAFGKIIVDIKGKGVYKGASLLIKNGKIILDGRTIGIPASPGN